MYEGYSEVSVQCPVCAQEMGIVLVWFEGSWEIDDMYHENGGDPCGESRHVNEASYMEDLVDRIRDKAIHPADN